MRCNARPPSKRPIRGAAAGRADLVEGFMSESRLVDITGRLRSPASTPGHWSGCAPPNKGVRYPADPLTVEEIIVVMRQAGPGSYADRTRGLIAIVWRAGLRISEALSLTETDLDPKTGSVLVRAGKGGKATDGRHGRLGLGARRSLDQAPRAAPNRPAVLHTRLAWMQRTWMNGATRAQSVRPAGRGSSPAGA